jgi:TonB family protein
MMSAYANSVQKPERFGLYLRKFRAICEMHGVPIGSGRDLPRFMQKLMDDRHLAMDFWALIGKLSNREGGELGDDEMLAVVVEGVTSGEASEDDGEMKRVTGELRAMLAGVDVQAPVQSQMPLAPFPRNESGPRRTEAEAGIHAVEFSSRLQDSRAAFMSEVANRETVEPASSARPHVPHVQLDEELLRAELTRLVERYFDNVDKSRPGESSDNPEAEGHAAQPLGSVASASTPRSLEEPVFRSRGASRLVLAPTAPAEDLLMTTSNTVPDRVPLEGYSEPAGYGKAILCLLLVMGLFEAIYAGYQHRLPLTREMNAMVEDFREKTGMSHSNLTYPPAAPIVDQSVSNTGSDAAAQSTKQQNSSLAQLSLHGVSTPPAPNAAANTARRQATSSASSGSRGSIRSSGSSGYSGPAGFSNPHVAGSRFDSSANRRAGDRSAVQADQEPDGISLADLAGAVYVSPAAMNANLFASRVPAYPESAKQDGVEGSVVMQAVISTDGTVKRVHVVKGDSRLRNAAIEAVYKWRYRPYLLSGRPVDVWTTVTVDFDLDR